MSVDQPHEAGVEETGWRPELEQKLSELDILRQSIEEAKLKEKDVYDQLLRLTAEFQNFRKRSEQRLIDARRAGREDVLTEVLSLADGLIQAEASSSNATQIETLKQGLTLVLGQFEKFLAGQGVIPIKTKGEKLDPHLHEAMMSLPSDDVEEGIIMNEIQRGYTLNGQVIRPARVAVSAGKASGSMDKEETTHG